MLQIIANGLAIGSVYSLFALGYTLSFSLLGIINFAHAALFSLGAYLAYLLNTGHFGGGLIAEREIMTAWPFFPALIGALLLTGLASLAMEATIFAQLRRRQAPPLLNLVCSLGLAMLLSNGLLLVFGAETKNLRPESLEFLPPIIDFGFAKMRGIHVLMCALCGVLCLLWAIMMRKSLFGHALSAIAENAETAALLGIPVARLISLTFFLAGGLAALSGVLVSAAFGISGPYFGLSFGLKGLAVIVVGGLGSFEGTVYAGLLLGLAEALVPGEYSGYRDAIAFSLLTIGLLLRPQGLLGRRIYVKA